MQIHDRFHGPEWLPPRRAEQRNASAPDGAPAREAAAASPEESMVQQLQGQPELRGELVALARSRVLSGAYLTAQAARDTAAAMLRQG